ncbi:uncharacterized protein BT62DRAFT_936046 [Guyanagaster necrorhizus]|uniref:Cytochrome c oxidase assembly protein COX16, mitochondrial n=1 Tax=Guyanagaster necrorhizus TaxID=856835 RepID=A0A9P8AP20_9AGAR|nr:uncharacterized protein BT62DRAFT_936046 [Guyanagaster necrorhizus MCA 3950]KAG7442489.1 hypothetical protein BT62DRAFT_936046 [Guyanagaster necrorhizus MCA 3950]
MPVFESKPLSQPKWQAVANKTFSKNPLIFGIPFVIIMVGASFAITPFTQIRYDLHDQKVKAVSKEQELGLSKNRKKFDIREEYYRLNAEVEDDWEQKRVPRPKGLPEWGVPPPEPPDKKS